MTTLKQIMSKLGKLSWEKRKKNKNELKRLSEMGKKGAKKRWSNK